MGAARFEELRQLLERREAELRDKDAAISFLKTKITSLQNQSRVAAYASSGQVVPNSPSVAVERDRRIEELEQQLLSAQQDVERLQRSPVHRMTSGGTGWELEEARRRLAERDREIDSLRRSLEWQEQESRSISERGAADLEELRQHFFVRGREVEELKRTLEGLDTSRREGHLELDLRRQTEQNRQLTALAQRMTEENDHLRVQLREAREEIAWLWRGLRERDCDLEHERDHASASGFATAHSPRHEARCATVTTTVVPCQAADAGAGSARPGGRPGGEAWAAVVPAEEEGRTSRESSLSSRELRRGADLGRAGGYNDVAGDVGGENVLLNVPASTLPPPPEGDPPSHPLLASALGEEGKGPATMARAPADDTGSLFSEGDSDECEGYTRLLVAKPLEEESPLREGCGENAHPTDGEEPLENHQDEDGQHLQAVSLSGGGALLSINFFDDGAEDIAAKEAKRQRVTRQIERRRQARGVGAIASSAGGGGGGTGTGAGSGQIPSLSSNMPDSGQQAVDSVAPRPAASAATAAAAVAAAAAAAVAAAAAAAGPFSRRNPAAQQEQQLPLRPNEEARLVPQSSRHPEHVRPREVITEQLETPRSRCRTTGSAVSSATAHALAEAWGSALPGPLMLASGATPSQMVPQLPLTGPATSHAGISGGCGGLVADEAAVNSAREPPSQSARKDAGGSQLPDSHQAANGLSPASGGFGGEGFLSDLATGGGASGGITPTLHSKFAGRRDEMKEMKRRRGNRVAGGPSPGCDNSAEVPEPLIAEANASAPPPTASAEAAADCRPTAYQPPCEPPPGSPRVNMVPPEQTSSAGSRSLVSTDAVTTSLAIAASSAQPHRGTATTAVTTVAPAAAAGTISGSGQQAPGQVQQIGTAALHPSSIPLDSARPLQARGLSRIVPSSSHQPPAVLIALAGSPASSHTSSPPISPQGRTGQLDKIVSTSMARPPQPQRLRSVPQESTAWSTSELDRSKKDMLSMSARNVSAATCSPGSTRVPPARHIDAAQQRQSRPGDIPGEIEHDALHEAIVRQQPAGRYALVRLSRGVYLYGNKKLVITIHNDKLMVRIGGGFVHLESYLADCDRSVVTMSPPAVASAVTASSVVMQPRLSSSGIGRGGTALARKSRTIA